VYSPSADDNTKPEDVMRFIDNALLSEFIYILGRDARHEAFIFSPNHNSTTYQAHFAVREDKRDGSIVKQVALSGKWIFENTGCRSIICFMRKDNHGARSVLSQLGMTRKGVIEKSVLFNGKFCDELIYQASVDDYNRLWADELGKVQDI
jgi:hypothetical protein